MRKAWILAWYSLMKTFRDKSALLIMLVTPFVLTLIIGAAFGSGSTGPTEVPLLIVDHDQSVWSHALIRHLNDSALNGIFASTVVTDEAAARHQVDQNQAAALLIIPAGLEARVFPFAALVRQQLGLNLYTMPPAELQQLPPAQQELIGQLFRQAQDSTPPPVSLEIYGSPLSPISVTTLKGITQGALEQMNMQLQGTMIVTGKLIELQSAQGTPGGSFNAPSFTDEADASDLPIHVQIIVPAGQAFNWFDYSAASMAVFFLMFTVTSGGRALLSEREGGTLPRLLVSPTPPLTILVGKMGSIVLIGLSQMLILWGATSLIGAHWGAAGGVLLAIIALVLCATGVGALITAWSRTARQAGALGTAVALIGAGFSGSFFPRFFLPTWVQTLSLITPNAWGIELFSRLQSGAAAGELLPWLAGVLAVTVIYYAIALLGFRRQFD